MEKMKTKQNIPFRQPGTRLSFSDRNLQRRTTTIRTGTFNCRKNVAKYWAGIKTHLALSSLDIMGITEVTHNAEKLNLIPHYKVIVKTNLARKEEEKKKRKTTKTKSTKQPPSPSPTPPIDNQHTTGGVALLIRDNSLFRIINHDSVVIEGKVTAIVATLIFANTFKLKVAVVYLNPEPSTPLTETDLQFFEGLDIVFGDFNARGHWDPGLSQASGLGRQRGKLIDSCTGNHNLRLILPHTPTATTKDGNAIDLIAHSRKVCGSHHSVVRSLASDHFLVTASITLNGQPSQAHHRPAVQWHRATPHMIHAYQKEVTERIGSLQPSATDDALSAFETTLLEAARIHLPHSGSRPAGVPRSVRESAQASQKLWETYDSVVARGATSDEQQQALIAASNASEIVSAHSLEQWRESMKKLDVHRVYKAHTVEMITDDLVLYNLDGTIASPDESARMLNEFYATKSPCMDDVEKLTPCPESTINDVAVVHWQEVHAAIKKQRHHCCRDPSLIDPNMLKKLPQCAKQFLADVFTDALQHAKVPSKWKHSVITPVYKGKGKPRHERNSYRPVANTSLLSRIWERVILQRMESILEAKLSKKQLGFRRKRSVAQALHTFFSQAEKGLKTKRKLRDTEYPTRPERHHSGHLLLLDFTDAYPRLPHRAILDQMHEWNLPKWSSDAITQWLVDRTMSTKCDGSISPPITINRGVPQGSVLGPVLYLIGSDKALQILQKTLDDMCDKTTIDHFCNSEKKKYEDQRNIEKKAREKEIRQSKKNGTLLESLKGGLGKKKWLPPPLPSHLADPIDVSAFDFRAYADDISLWIFGLWGDRCLGNLQHLTNALTTWSDATGIDLSIKTEIVPLEAGARKPASNAKPLQFSLGSGRLIGPSPVGRHLGVMVDTKLSMAVDLRNLVLKSEQVCDTLHNIRLLVSQHGLRQAYAAYFLSHLPHRAAALSRLRQQRSSWPLLEAQHAKAARIIMGTIKTAASDACVLQAGLYPLSLITDRHLARLQARCRRLEDEDSPDQPTSRPPREILEPELTALPYDVEWASRQMGNLSFWMDRGSDAKTGTKIGRQSTTLQRALDNEHRYNAATTDGKPRYLLFTDGAVIQATRRHPIASAAAAILCEESDSSLMNLSEMATNSGPYACSYTAEDVALNCGLSMAVDKIADPTPDNNIFIICSDSLSEISALATGPLMQTATRTANTMHNLLHLCERGWLVRVVFQFSHCMELFTDPALRDTRTCAPWMHGNDRVDKMADALATKIREECLPFNPTDAACFVGSRDESRHHWNQRKTEWMNDAKKSCTLRSNWSPNYFALAKVARPIEHFLSAKSIRIHAQLATGVFPKWGGLSEKSTPCPLCNAPNSLSRGGKAIEHLFSCPQLSDLRDQTTQNSPTLRARHAAGKGAFDPSLLYENSADLIMSMARYAERAVARVAATQKE